MQENLQDTKNHSCILITGFMKNISLKYKVFLFRFIFNSLFFEIIILHILHLQPLHLPLYTLKCTVEEL